MVERVRRLYDTRTDTEAIQKALRKAIDDAAHLITFDTVLSVTPRSRAIAEVVMPSRSR
jgi:hypothetical protein